MITKVFSRVLCILCALFFSCSRHDNIVQYESITGEVEVQSPGYNHLPDPLRLYAAQIAASMDDRLLAAQVLFSGIDGSGTVPAHIISLLEEYPVGGIILFRYNLNAENDSIRDFLLKTASVVTETSGIHPFIAVDHEGGTVNRFRQGVADLPDASIYWSELASSLSDGEPVMEKWQSALEKIKADSFRAGSVIFDLGINMNFAPVAEYLNDDNYDFLYRRSYGPDPIFTAQAASVFIQGMEQAGVLCVIKHFPGSAGYDPHYSLSVINGKKEYLDILVYPFAEAIRNGARAVMVAHTAVTAIDSYIASLSPVVMNDWLRNGLAFDGIIISDDFSMTAAGGLSPQKAAVLSVSAGADMVLVWPPDLARTHQAFITALEDGSLSRERLLDAVTRIIYEKLRWGIEIRN